MVFATQVSEGVSGPDDCPIVDEQAKKKIQEYLGSFQRSSLS